MQLGCGLGLEDHSYQRPPISPLAAKAGIAMVNIIAAMTKATATTTSKRFIKAQPLFYGNPVGLLLPSIEAGGDELSMNRGRIPTLFTEVRGRLTFCELRLILQ
jgi:hypothetical protein